MNILYPGVKISKQNKFELPIKWIKEHQWSYHIFSFNYQCTCGLTIVV